MYLQQLWVFSITPVVPALKYSCAHGWDHNHLQTWPSTTGPIALTKYAHRKKRAETLQRLWHVTSWKMLSPLLNNHQCWWKTDVLICEAHVQHRHSIVLFSHTLSASNVQAVLHLLSVAAFWELHFTIFPKSLSCVASGFILHLIFPLPVPNTYRSGLFFWWAQNQIFCWMPVW